MILTHIDLKYVSLIYRKIRKKVPNGKGLNKMLTDRADLYTGTTLHSSQKSSQQKWRSNDNSYWTSVTEPTL